MTTLFSRFARNESGATAIEYGLIAGLISITVVAGAALAGPKILAIFNQIATSLPAVAT